MDIKAMVVSLLPDGASCVIYTVRSGKETVAVSDMDAVAEMVKVAGEKQSLYKRFAEYQRKLGEKF